MSDTPANSPRPVALITTLFIFALVGIGFALIKHYYDPTAVASFNTQAENLPKDLAWKATPATRRLALADLRDKQTKQAEKYAWVDEKAGVVQLPIARAMELTAAQYGSKK